MLLVAMLKISLNFNFMSILGANVVFKTSPRHTYKKHDLKSGSMEVH